MTVHLDHLMVPSRNKSASAKLLAELLGVPWAETGVGPFSPVYVNDGLTLDFIETDEHFPIHHYYFRVGQEEFKDAMGPPRGSKIPLGGPEKSAPDALSSITSHRSAGRTGRGWWCSRSPWPWPAACWRATATRSARWCASKPRAG